MSEQPRFRVPLAILGQALLNHHVEDAPDDDHAP